MIMVKVAVAQMVSGEVLADNLTTVALLAARGCGRICLNVAYFCLKTLRLLDSKALISLAARGGDVAGIIQKTISEPGKTIWPMDYRRQCPAVIAVLATKVYASCLVFNQLGRSSGPVR